MSRLHYTLDVRDAARRHVKVSLELDRSALTKTEQRSGSWIFFLPVWTPGSYLVREYSRHLGPVRSTAAGSDRKLSCTKIAKNRFEVEWPEDVESIRLDYTVYAHELTVRSSDLTNDHAYWNHACVLLWPVGHYRLPATIRVLKPAHWELACALTTDQQGPDSVVMQAADLDEAIDSPALCADFERHRIDVRGVSHEVVLDGLGPIGAAPKFLDDVRKIVEAAADVFDGALPYERYQFQCLFTDRGHGGLEHRNSTTLLASRTAMSGGKAYQDFLGLVAHELFHAWNVKRMRPAEFWTYDYESENHTPMLWLAEGFTAYYDDLLCRRIGALSRSEYLAIVATNLTNMWAGEGRHNQSLNEASFDAWIRLYRPDENTRNSTQNYYGNGAVAAMVLDLAIRDATDGERCLDHALQYLWRDTYKQHRGYERGDVERCLAEAAGEDLTDLLGGLVDGPLDPAIDDALRPFGLELDRAVRKLPHLGVRFTADSTDIHSVVQDGPAYRGGLAPGDEILALDGLRVTSSNWSEVSKAVIRPEQELTILISSRGIVQERRVVPAPARPDLTIRPVGNRGSREKRLLQGWLGDES